MADEQDDARDGQQQGEKDQHGGGDDGAPPQKPAARWPWFVAGAVAIVFLIVVLLLIFLPQRIVKTNDAYVTARYTTVAPRVSGQIATVDVDDNQPVRAGQRLATIDDRDLRTSLASAEANYQSDQARVAQADAQVRRQPSFIRQALAQVASARARLHLSEVDAVRYANLATTGAGTVQQRQQADAQLETDRAALLSADANLDAARRQLDALASDRQAAQARLGIDRAQIAQVRLNLSYTRILAPIDGTVGEKSVQVGNQVTPAAPIMVVVPLHDVWIMANYRELALRHMRPGQHVSIHVDAYDVTLDGIVASIAPASGTSFSPIPPNNATGNFTKIVQRLPVKIVLAPNQPLGRLLRPGMSVETRVDTGLEDVVGEQARSPGWITAR